VDWIHLAQDKMQPQALVNTARKVHYQVLSAHEQTVYLSHLRHFTTFFSCLINRTNAKYRLGAAIR
jgi:hypothetical protein